MIVRTLSGSVIVIPAALCTFTYSNQPNGTWTFHIYEAGCESGWPLAADSESVRRTILAWAAEMKLPSSDYDLALMAMRGETP